MQSAVAGTAVPAAFADDMAGEEAMPPAVVRQVQPVQAAEVAMHCADFQYWSSSLASGRMVRACW